MLKKQFSTYLILSIVLQLFIGVILVSPNVVKAYGNGFNYSRSITVDHTKVPNTDQTDFPVLVSGTYSYLANIANGGKIQDANNAYDLGFYTNSNCSTGKLAWERESHATSTGAVNYWVKVPTLSHTSDTVIYMCYGNSSVTTDQSNASGVWDTNYKGVWHLPNGSGLSANDSTSNSNNCSITGSTATTAVINGGALFNGTTDKIDCGSNSSLINITQAVTIDLWAKRTTSGMGGLLAGTYGVGADYGYDLYFDLNSTNHLWFVNQSVAAYSTVGTYTDTTSFHKITATYDRNNVIIYYDGAVVLNTPATAAMIPAVGTFRIGQRADGSAGFNGAIDEVRVSNTARSADWVATEYNNQSSPSTFYAVGSESSDTTSPSAPTSFTATPSGSNIHFSWTNPNDSDFSTVSIFGSDSVYIPDPNHGGAVVTGTGGTSWDVSSVSDGTYYYSIFAYDNAGNFSTLATTTATVDTIAPTLSEVTPVSSPTSNTTPSYTISSSEAGTISYGGSCTSTTTSASSGNNTITFNSLSDGTYSNCTITVTDVSSNTSSLLSVTSFTIASPTTTTVVSGSRTGGGSASVQDMLVFRRNEICSPGSIFNLLTGERCFNANSEPRSFTKDLKFGMNDIQVKLLQQYLNSHGFPVAKTGIGSLGKETAYFGSATRSALIKFQISKKIQPSLGYFGPVTRKFVLEK